MSICPICSSTIYTNFRNGNYLLYKCTNCKAIWTPTVEDEEYYKREYTLVSKLSEFEQHRRYIERLPEQWKLISTIKKYSKGKNLLDIGCDYGHFLDVARKAGFKVEGVELSENARLFCSMNSLKVYEELSTVPQKTFDIITLWHVYEHVEKPVDFLKEINSSYCHSETTVYIRVPDFASLPSKLFKNKWIWFQPKQHHLHFTKSSLSFALIEAGFAVVSITSQRPNTIKTMFGTIYALFVESEFQKRNFKSTIKAVLRMLWHYISSVEVFAIAMQNKK